MGAATSAVPAKKIALPNLGEAFSMPLVSPELDPPPYRYKDTRHLNILFKTDPQLLAKLVPPPLQPNPNQLMIFYIGLFQFADYDLPYHEAGLLIPVICEGQSGNYAISVLYLGIGEPTLLWAGGKYTHASWPKKEERRSILFLL